jgi:hypothetical protein
MARLMWVFAVIGSEHRRFAMLHDLTNCLRIGDATVFGTPDEKNVQTIYLHELKTNPGAQLARTRMAAEALDVNGPLPGPDKARLIETGIPYASHLSALRDAFTWRRRPAGDRGGRRRPARCAHCRGASWRRAAPRPSSPSRRRGCVPPPGPASSSIPPRRSWCG